MKQQEQKKNEGSAGVAGQKKWGASSVCVWLVVEQAGWSGVG